MKRLSTRTLVEISLTIALSAVLGTITLWKMPQGGSVSLVMLPILILALRRGPVVGILAGGLYGVVDSFIDPYVVHWAQYALDYPVAFAALGIAGVLAPLNRSADDSQRKIQLLTVVLPAFLLGAVGRYAAHVASGVIFFGEYAPEGQNVLLYSAVYNSTVIVAAVVSYAAALLVLPALDRALGDPVEA